MVLNYILVGCPWRSLVKGTLICNNVKVPTKHFFVFVVQWVQNSPLLSIVTQKKRMINNSNSRGTCNAKRFWVFWSRRVEQRSFLCWKAQRPVLRTENASRQQIVSFCFVLFKNSAPFLSYMSNKARHILPLKRVKCLPFSSQPKQLNLVPRCSR